MPGNTHYAKTVEDALEQGRKIHKAEAVRLLSEITIGWTRDAATMHVEADRIILASLPIDVRAAYEDVRKRAPWWAFA